MSILTGSAIVEEIAQKRIVIEPFNPEQVNPNSYNLRLGSKLLIYKTSILDMRRDNPVQEIKIPEEGLYLNPGVH
jgi:deoxycytidine triphosphate deaminase